MDQSRKINNYTTHNWRLSKRSTNLTVISSSVTCLLVSDVTKVVFGRPVALDIRDKVL